MMRTNRLQWLHTAMQTSDGKVGYLKGCYWLKKWMHKHGYGEVRDGRDWYITDKGRAAVASAIAEYDRHGRLSQALPGDQRQPFIDHAHCKVCERDEKAAWEEWRKNNPPTEEQQRAHKQLMRRMLASDSQPRAVFVNPDTYAALVRALAK